jgi:hypothetical protein
MKTKHIEDPGRPGSTLCEKEFTRLDEDDHLVVLGVHFSCDACKKAVQSYLDKFMTPEWATIIDMAAKHGFTLTLEMNPVGGVFCTVNGPSIQHIRLGAGTAVAAALVATKEIVKMCRDTVRTTVWSVDGETVSGTREAYQKSKKAMSDLNRAISFYEEMQDFAEVLRMKRS